MTRVRRSVSGLVPFAKLLLAVQEMRPYAVVSETPKLMEEAQAFIGALAELRRSAVRELRRQGCTWDEVGRLCGISSARAQALISDRPARWAGAGGQQASPSSA